ncbi:MAG: gliding motility-associated C-terminal domain-containing protein [Bacteroidales bacterium]|nr:gliding motility-associated C-terminal domain-containing protein [Bacteroidales bacterium]
MSRILALFFLFVVCGLGAAAQSASPTMSIVEDDGTETEEVSYEGSAPLQVIFRANASDYDDYNVYYHWTFTNDDTEEVFLTRYDEETTYTFSQSGSYTIELTVTFIAGTDTVEYTMDDPFTITITESKLEVPNAFTPNGDGVNDVFRVKEGYESILSFKAAVFNRWGKKLYEWTDIEGGWDGTSGGKDVPDGAYYLVINAQGADGINYKIKKVINVLRGYTESE